MLLMRRHQDNDDDDDDHGDMGFYDGNLEIQNQQEVQVESQAIMAGPPLQSYVEPAVGQVSGPPVMTTEIESFTPTVCGDCGYGFHPGSPWVSCITCGAARHPQCAMNTPSCWTCHSSSNETTSQS